jgi:hypothetical protein
VVEKQFCALGPAAEAFLVGAAATSAGRAADIRSILATAGAAPVPRPAGESLADVLTLPMVPTRSLDAYKINTGTGEDGDQPW